MWPVPTDSRRRRLGAGAPRRPGTHRPRRNQRGARTLGHAQLLGNVKQDVPLLHGVLGAHAILCRRRGARGGKEKRARVARRGGRQLVPRARLRPPFRRSRPARPPPDPCSLSAMAPRATWAERARASTRRTGRCMVVGAASKLGAACGRGSGARRVNIGAPCQRAAVLGRAVAAQAGRGTGCREQAGLSRRQVRGQMPHLAVEEGGSVWRARSGARCI